MNKKICVIGYIIKMQFVIKTTYRVVWKKLYKSKFFMLFQIRWYQLEI